MGAIWEQLEGESHKAYAAFCVFRDMLPGERTYAKVAEKLGYHWNGVAKWASPNRFNWQERAAAYDAYKSKNQIELRQADLVEAQQHALQQEGTEIAAAMLLVTRTYQELLKRDPAPDPLDLHRLVQSLEKLQDMRRRNLGLPVTYRTETVAEVPNEQPIYYAQPDIGGSDDES